MPAKQFAYGTQRARDPVLFFSFLIYFRLLQVLLLELLSLDDDALKSEVLGEGSPVDTSFLAWLAEKHDDTPEEHRLELHLLGGRIMSLKYGLVPESAEEVLAAEQALILALKDKQDSQTGSSVQVWQANREIVLLERVSLAV